jgi:histidinol-phosphate aminotransferase
MLEAQAVESFLERLPGHVVLVLDEAYYEFAQHFSVLRKVNYSNSLDYVKQGASVVVLRTFSKAHGLAGLRIGYGIGPAELLAYCARMRSTFSVSSVAQAAALAALDDSPHIRRVVENTVGQAQQMVTSLSALGYRVLPTSANFLFCDVGMDAAVFAKELQEEGVAVRPLRHWGAPTSIRVTIGTPEQNDMFMRAAGKIARRSSTAERKTV